MCISFGFNLQGQTPIASAVFTENNTGLTMTNYTATSPSDASGGISDNKDYVVSYGEDYNLLIDSYTVGATVYDNFVLPDTLFIQRVDTDRQLIIFYETDLLNDGPDPGILDLKAEQVDNEEALYETGFANAGYDNILVNDATNFANVERVDVIYFQGVVTSTPANAVFPIVERGGNDDIRVAAIRGLDANGQPNDYYPTVIRVSDDGTTDWGGLGRNMTTTVLRRQSLITNPIPVQEVGSQTISGSAISFDEFGVAANEIVYGYSIFADDVTATGSDLIDFTNATNFPRNTGSVSGLDLIAGISTAVASDDNLIKVSGPGGYKPALNTWLKANAGVTTDTDNNPVTDWQDQFLGDHDATTLGTAPTYRDGSASALEDINFNPTIDYISAVERGLQIADNTDFNTATYERKSINIAFRTGDNVTVKQQIYEQGGTTRGISVYVRNGDLYVGAWNQANDGAGSPWNFNAVSAGVSTDTEYIVTIELDGNNTTTGELRAFLNGQSIGTVSNVGLLYPHADDIGIGDVAGGARYDDGTTNAASFYGSIPEFIYCNEPASFPAIQRNQIESYLAVKYGITLDQSTAVSYYNSDGVVVYNTSLNASLGGYLEYNNDIAGLARDDESEFLQLQSQSENPNSIVEMERLTTIGNDDTWLLWGNDGGATTTSQVLSAPDGVSERLERVWRVAERNELGVTEVSFDLTGLGLGTNPDDFSLLIAGASSNADFSSAQAISGGTISGNVITFSGVSFTNGEYFTLGTQFFICTPGNVANGLALWLKADAETYNTGTILATNGQTVATWGDQSRNNFDAVEGTNRNPTWVATDVNFNPGLNFPDDGGANEIGFNLGSNYIFADDANGGMHIFAAIEPIDVGTDNNSRQQKMIYSFGDRTSAAVGIGASDQRLTIQVPGDNNNDDISPSASEFILEGDYNISASVSDVHSVNIDGEQVRTEVFSYQLNNAAITEAATHGTNEGPVSIGRVSKANNIDNNNGRRYFGDLQEVIVYNEAISDIEAQRVRSYLAIKYGTTLTNDNNANTTPNETISGAVQEGDYVASDGTTIVFDYSDDTGFVTNVAGIGRDDDSCLEQKQSRSVNSDAILTVGLGEIAANNAANANSFDDDLDFFTWGSDGASTAFANITTSGTPGTVTDRMLRVWRAQDTGNVGNTDISFDLSALPGYSTDADEYQLIIASGGDNTSLENGSTITGGTFNGSVITFNDVNLTDGQYFTLGVASETCGPGGVATNLELWLRADRQVFNTGTTQATDGQTVATWSDQSVSNADATDPSNLTTFETNTVNFNPAIEFNNDATSLQGTFTTSIAGLTQFTAAFFNSSSANGDAFYELNGPSGGGDRSFFLNTRYGGNTNFTTNIIADQWAFWSVDHPSGNTANIFENGGSFESSYNATLSNATAGAYDYTLGDDDSGGNDFVGFLGDVIVYQGTLTATERSRVETYLAIKYGVTIDQTVATDYIWSNGTTVLWNATTNASYNNDIAGIGRDDLSCFSQKQATSVNSDDILTMGLGNVAATNADNANFFDDNGDYLIWGNDDGATAQASVNTADVPSGLAERMERIWRVEDTGNVGATEIQFDLAGLGYSSDASDFRLIIAGSGSGGTMSGGSLTAGGTFNGDVLSFTGVDLADGEYFTLGMIEQCGPGGVNTNVALWLRADEQVFSDAGTTLAADNDDVLQWNDQSILGRNASETNAGGGTPIEPAFQENDMNFNPSIFISDQNTTNNSYLETGGGTNNVADDMTLISVFRTGQSQGTNNQMDNTPALIGAEANADNNDYGLGLYQGEVVFNATNDNAFTVRSTTTYNDQEPYIATGTRIRNGAVNLFVNSENLASSTSADVALSTPDTWAIGNQNGYDNEAQLQASVAEVIVFSNDLTNEELARVETYLAIKYGITRTDDNNSNSTPNEVISGAIREGDYVAADGGVVWDYAARNSTFYNDIAGIGRDDLSCLNQLRSKSENNDAIVDIGISSFPDDDSWLVWGNDNAPIEAINNNERPPGINSRLNREWQAQETGTLGAVDVTFDISDVTGTPIGDNNLNLVRMMVSTDDDFRSGVTLISPSSIDPVARTATFNYDFTPGEGFYYTLGSEEVDALPIELVSFEVKSTAGGVRLNWTTASEENNAFFTIERSTDGMNFEEIGFREGAGNSDGINTYEFIDQRPKAGNNFYRIKQTDTDGTSTFTSVLRVRIDEFAHLELTVYPNPSLGGQVYLKHNMPERVGSIVLFNIKGEPVESTQTHKSGTTPLNISGLPEGVYFLKVSFENRTFTQKLIVR